MSYYHFFKVSKESVVLGKGRYSLDLIDSSNGYFYYSRLADNQKEIVKHTEKNISLSAFGEEYFNDLGKDVGSFFYSYCLLGRKEGPLDFVRNEMKNDEKNIIKKDSLDVRKIYFYEMQ